MLLEIVRYHPQEEANDPDFSKQLAALCDGLFVCDAFGSAHRAHSSVVGITKFVRQAAAGLLMERELSYLGKALTNPARPFVAVLGGAKVSDKIEVVENLMKIADAMLIGGGMAYTFLKSQGLPIGKSLLEADKLDLARRVIQEAGARKFPLLLPTDHVVGAEFKADTQTRTMSVADTPDDWMGLDIGPETVKRFSAEIAGAKTIVWNGPMGVFEMPAFARGTIEMANAIAAATTLGATSIVGGGDSVAAVHQAGVAGRVSHISTGGGASLEFPRRQETARRRGSDGQGIAVHSSGHQREVPCAKTGNGGQLEDVQDTSRGGRLLCRAQAAGRYRHALRNCHRAALHGCRSVGAGGRGFRDLDRCAGLFTGFRKAPSRARISRPNMLVEAGCGSVIIAHSERRQFFGETDESAGWKVKAALGAALTPILCVGELLAERESNQMRSVLQRQFLGALAALTAAEFSRIIVAYEPVWAIGTGRTATPEIAAEAHRFLRDLAGELFGSERAAELRILYGGSVKPDNVKALMAQVDIDGALVGGASLDPQQFASKVNF